jgi:hypothetical protein
MTSSSVKRADQAAAARTGWSISGVIAIETAANINARQAMTLQSLYSVAANTVSLWAGRGGCGPCGARLRGSRSQGGRPIGSAIRGSTAMWLAASGPRRRSRTLAFAERRGRESRTARSPMQEFKGGYIVARRRQLGSCCILRSSRLVANKSAGHSEDSHSSDSKAPGLTSG